MPTDPTPVPPPASVAEQNPASAGEMGAMFDEVSGRYDLMNSIMSLGRDQAWRQAMWAEVPEEAHVVVDLATGNGVSLGGLRRPGRLVVGVDLSLIMLQQAARTHGRAGWAPRLLCGDAFRLPLRAGVVDAITVAFGVRNFRPRRAALTELARVLAPRGLLVVLEATSPRPGPLAPLHAFYIRHVIPLAGQVSSKPDAYRYLSRSIEEFGSGPEFEADLGAAGFEIEARRSFLLGATRLWVVRRAAGATAGASRAAGTVQSARLGVVPRGEMRSGEAPASSEWRLWTGLQIMFSMALLTALIFATTRFVDFQGRLPLEPWQRSGMWLLLVAGMAGFLVRTVFLVLRLLGPPPRR